MSLLLVVWNVISNIVIGVLVPVILFMLQRNKKTMQEIHVLVNSKMTNALQEIEDLKKHIFQLENK